MISSAVTLRLSSSSVVPTAPSRATTPTVPALIVRSSSSPPLLLTVFPKVTSPPAGTAPPFVVSIVRSFATITGFPISTVPPASVISVPASVSVALLLPSNEPEPLIVPLSVWF